MSDQRITDLELRYMKLEHTVEQLSTVLAAQQKTIDRLMKELSAQGSRLRDLADPTSGDEKPPHY
jgi:SlyX protein